jgi:mono/diheme cytochrome c family protein
MDLGSRRAGLLAVAVGLLGPGPSVGVAADAGGPSGASGKQVYEQQCAKCHGTSGKGDGPMGAALQPKPTDFTNGKVMAGKTEAQIEAVVRDGGAAHGLSKEMPTFQSVLTPAQIKAVSTYVESFAKAAGGKKK